MHSCELRLLGRFELLVDGQNVPLSGKAKELLAYLALQPRKRAFRHQVSGALWPETTDERALRNLSTCLWRLRMSLERFTFTRFVVISRAEVSLDSVQMKVDYWEFEECVNRALDGEEQRMCSARAIELYRGELVEGECDSGWLIDERERARLMHLRVLEAHAQSLIKVGAAADALRAYERLMELDPINEEACRRLMTLHYSVGNTTEALRRYSSFSEKLRSELNVAPEVETRHLYDAIKSGRSLGLETGLGATWRAIHRSDGQTAMIGRTEELELLRDALDRASRAHLVILGVEGEAGIGKTRLTIEFAREAVEKGWRILRTACEELPRAGPYTPFLGLVDVTARFDNQGAEPARRYLFPDPAVSTRGGSGRRDLKVTSEERAVFLEAIASWLRDEAKVNPLVLVIEDLQFADSASVDLLVYLAGEIKDCRLMILLTWRPEEYAARIARLARADGILAKVLSLRRLSEVEIERLCQAFVGSIDLPQGLVQHVYRESEGNPLFALEVLKSLEIPEPGTVLGAPAAVSGAESRSFRRSSQESILPIGIRRALSKRLDRLPAEAKRFLSYASACGRRLDIELLARTMHLPPEDLARFLKLLAKLGFVGSSGNDYQFPHEKIREFCYEELSSAARIAVHRDVLRTLESFWPDRLDELAFHGERAGERAKAGTCWEVLGDRATLIWAHRDAVKAYTRALENWVASGSAQDGIRFELLKKRASAWELSGEIEKGEGDIEEMLLIARRSRDEVRRCETLTFQSRLLLRRGLFREAGDKARESLDLAVVLGNSNLEARSREVLAFSYYRSSHYDEAKRMFMNLVPMLERLDDHECLERVWNRIGSLQAAGGDLEGLRSLDKAEKFSKGDLNERAVRNLLRGQTLAFMGKGDEAKIALQFAETDYRRAGNHSGRALVNGMLALVHGCTGDLVSAIKHARRGVPFKCGKAEAYWRVLSSTNLGHGVLLGLGNYRLAHRIAIKALSLLPQIGGRTKANLLDLAATIDLEQGDLSTAHEYALRALGEVWENSDPALGNCLATLGRVNLALGHPERAVDLLRLAVDFLDAETNHLELAQAYSYLGVALQNAGSLDEALTSSQRAVRLLTTRNGFAYRAQELLWNHFIVLRSRGDPGATLALRRAYGIVVGQAARLGAKMRGRYLSIPVNGEIVDTWEKVLGRGRFLQDPRHGGVGIDRQLLQPGRVILLIPRTGAPWGRPLRADEFVEVIWTVDAGRQDEALRELKGEVGLRRARILRLCAEGNVQGGDPREEDLARVLGVSTRTIRSDIAYLRAQGCSLQTRGANLH